MRASNLYLLLAGATGAVTLASPASPTFPGAADGGAAETHEVVVERRLGCMGTELGLRVAAPDRARALAASEEVVRALAAAEARLSTWRDDSELARLNAAPVGTPHALSPELGRELAAARAWMLATDGAFDPGVGALARAWGLRSGGRQPSPTEIADALRSGGMGALELGRDHAVRTRPGLVLEEGGFGKGAGLDDALRALAETEALWAVLDLGGQLALFGTGAAGSFAIADPTQRGESVAQITIDRGSLATSGNSERGIVVAGTPRSHLLDPRAGAPAEDFGSLTVWTASPFDADCLSTGLYVMGPEAALAWAAEHAGVEILVAETTSTGVRLSATQGLATHLTLPADAPPLRIVGTEPEHPSD